MWLFDRRQVIVGGLLALGACGFTPAYGPDGNGSALQGRVQMAQPATPQQFRLVQRLEERLGQGGETAPYRLTYGVSVSSGGLGATSSGRTVRVRLTGTVNYDLKLDGASVNKGRVTSFTGYSNTSSTVATRAARNDAEDRLMVILADRVVDELLLGPGSAPQTFELPE